MTAAHLLFHQCRKAGIILAGDGDSITFDAPPGVAVPVDDIRRCKAGLLTVLRGANDPVAEKIRKQLDALVSHRTTDGRTVLVHPAHRRELEDLGLL